MTLAHPARQRVAYLGKEQVKVTLARPLCCLTQSANSPNVALAGRVCTNGGPLGTRICNLAESYVFFSPDEDDPVPAALGAAAAAGAAPDSGRSGLRPSRRAFSRAALAARSRLSASICSLMRLRAARSSSFSARESVICCKSRPLQRRKPLSRFRQIGTERHHWTRATYPSCAESRRVPPP